MKKRKFIINLFAAAAFLVGCNESLEDTYSDYAGDGSIRYVAKCSEMKVVSGWKRLIVSWKNGIDATVDSIKLTWTSEELRDSILLPSDATSHTIENLDDGTYRFDVCAINKSGKESLKETIYARPYTEKHEIMLAFTRGIIKAYFVNDKLIFFPDHWNENIKELILHYTGTDGEKKEYVFSEKTGLKLVTISDIDLDKRIYVSRIGKPIGCPDNIPFEDYILSENKKDFESKKTYTVGFTHAIERRYGYSRETKEEEVKFNEFINTVEELEFDYELESFEDILHCPKLKKLVFGKNRYLDNFSVGYQQPSDVSKLLGDIEKSLEVVNMANKEMKLTIDWHAIANDADFCPYFFKKKTWFMKWQDVLFVPDNVKVISKDELKEFDGKRIICTPSDLYADVDLLLDNISSNKWETMSEKNEMRTYELQMQFEEPTFIDGIKVTQSLYNPFQDNRTAPFMPTDISAQTSMDGVNWVNVTFFETNDLGCGSGETTLLQTVNHVTKQPESREVRYLRFTVRDGVDKGGNCMISLGDLLPYKLEN